MTSLTQFRQIRRTNGHIIAQTPDGTEVVIPDKDWTEVEQWEDISRDLLESAIDFGNDDVFSNPALPVTIDIQTAVEILRDEGYVEYDNERQEQLKARLLLEYLCAEGIYSLENSGVGILRDPNDPLSKGVVINWAILFQLCSEKVDTIIQTAANKQHELKEDYSHRKSVEHYTELFADVYQMVDGNEQAIADGITSENTNVPDSVDEKERPEYKRKVAQLKNYLPIVSDKVMSQIIGELEAQMATFHYHSQRLRQQVTLIEARDIRNAIEEIGDILSEFDFLSVDEQDIDAQTIRDATLGSVDIEDIDLNEDGDILSGVEDPPEQEEQTIGDFLSDLDEKPKDK